MKRKRNLFIGGFLGWLLLFLFWGQKPGKAANTFFYFFKLYGRTIFSSLDWDFNRKINGLDYGYLIRLNPNTSGRWGVALGGWGKTGECFGPEGENIPCENDYHRHERPDFAEMRARSYRNPRFGFSPLAFNIAPPYQLDPLANTQMVWFHYLNEIPHRDILLQVNTPGAIMGYYDPEEKRVVLLEDNDGFPIWQKEKFRTWLENHQNFDDGWGNWYGFYLLAEVESAGHSYSLSPADYIKVVNKYAEFLSSIYPSHPINSGSFRPRIILSSPYIGGVSTNERGEVVVDDRKNIYQPYYTTVWNGLSSLAKQMVAFNSIDFFYGPVPAPDYQIGNFSPVTDERLQEIASRLINIINEAGNFFWNLNGRETLVTQFGVLLHAPVSSPANWPRPRCQWCQTDNDVWATTEWGMARLTQLVLQQLNRYAASNHVVAWAWWGSIRQSKWTSWSGYEWGDLQHGIMWLSWPILCLEVNNCPGPTGEVWPSRVGMVYLHAANGELFWRDPEAPSWWPK